MSKEWPSEPTGETVTASPAVAALEGLVDRYEGYQLSGFAPATHQGLPSRYLTFVVSLADPVDLAVLPDSTQRGVRLRALVAGLHQAPAVIRHDGDQHGIHVRVDPFAAQSLFGVPAGALASSVADLADLWGRQQAAELLDRLATASSWPARLAELDSFLEGRLRSPRHVLAPEVNWAWQSLRASGGLRGIQSLASEVGWSRRHLSEQFRQEFGLSPKAAARVLRFERACTLLRRPDRPDLATTAATCGYYDQAHLNREWRDLAGCTPGEWLRDEVLGLPSVQDGTIAAGAA